MLANEATHNEPIENSHENERHERLEHDRDHVGHDVGDCLVGAGAPRSDVVEKVGYVEERDHEKHDEEHERQVASFLKLAKFLRMAVENEHEAVERDEHGYHGGRVRDKSTQERDELARFHARGRETAAEHDVRFEYEQLEREHEAIGDRLACVQEAHVGF